MERGRLHTLPNHVELLGELREDRESKRSGITEVASLRGPYTIGLYQLQAAVAAVHDEAERAEDTDWPQILALYELLRRVSPSPMVTLNHAIATAMVHGPSKGLELLKGLDSDGRVAEHHRLDAVRAHFLEMLGNHESAVKHYRTAAGRTTSIPERDYLMAQAARLDQESRGPERNGLPDDLRK